jgi:hypothetical protein
MRAVTAFVAALALAAPLTGRAQPVSEPAGPDTYLLFHLGAFVPQGDIHALDTGYTLGAAVGARFTERLAVEGGLAFDRSTGPGVGRPVFEDLPISVSLVGRLPFKRAELAAYAGADLHLVRWAVDLPPSERWRDTAFGAHAGLRASVNLWPTILVGVDLRGELAEARLDVSRRIDAVRAAVTLQYRF